MAAPNWKRFEDAARELIKLHQDFFGLASVEPTEAKVTGSSGYEWNIEIVAHQEHSFGLVLFECRQKRRNITPAEAAELAYRVLDTGAERGYFITPIGKKLSSGATTIAAHEGIEQIQIADYSTTQNYMMQGRDFAFWESCTISVRIVRGSLSIKIIIACIKIQFDPNIHVRLVMTTAKHLAS